MLYQTTYNPDLSCAYTQVMFNYMKALEAEGVVFRTRVYGGMLNWRLCPTWAESLSYHLAKGEPNNKVVLNHFQIGDLAKAPSPKGGCSIGLTAFETTTIPSWIIQTLNDSLDGIIVPSRHNYDVLKSCGLSIQCHVVEHALSSIWTSDIPRHKGKEPPHVFGYVGAWNSRKNPLKVVEAYLKAFPNKTESTALLIKTYAPTGIEDQISYLIKKLSADKKRPDIWLYNELWDESQMIWVYGQIDTYVSAHKGEGFGLGLAQAAAQGIPVIYTDYSAPTEWLPVEAGHIPVACEVVDVVGASDAYNLHFAAMEGDRLQWADILEEDLISSLRKRATEFSGTRNDHKLKIRHELSWSEIGKKLSTAIESIAGIALERVDQNG